MKRIFCFVLTTLLLVCVCFTSSGCTAFDETGFFKKNILASEGVAGLESPNYTLSFSRYSETCGIIERSEFNRYAQYLLNFLTERYDCVGTEGYEYSTFFGGAGRYKYKECDINDLSTYACEVDDGYCHYIFVYFTETPVQGDETERKIELWFFSNNVHTTFNHEEKSPEFYFKMRFNNLYGVTDKYIFTPYEPFDVYNFGEEAVDGINEPVVNVIRTEEKWNELFGDSYKGYRPNFLKNFAISIFINCPNKETCTYYAVESVVKNDNGYTIEIEMWQTSSYEYTAWNLVIKLQNEVNIYDTSDFNIQFIERSPSEMSDRYTHTNH